MSPKYFMAVLIRQPVDTFPGDVCKRLFQCFGAGKLISTSQLRMEGQGKGMGKPARLSPKV